MVKVTNGVCVYARVQCNMLVVIAVECSLCGETAHGHDCGLCARVCCPELAFSSLPTIAQIKGLKAFGFRSLVNLCHPSQVSDGRLDAEAEAVASLGIAYTHLAPPGAEVPAAEPQQLPCETATDDGAASGAGAGAGAGTGTPTGDLAPSPLTRTSSYVRHTQDGTLLLRPFTYDLAWVRSALCSVRATPGGVGSRVERHARVRPVVDPPE